MYELLEKYLPRDKRVRMGILMAADVLALCLASFLGLFVRFDLNISRIPPEYASSCSTVTLKPCEAGALTATGTPPFR